MSVSFNYVEPSPEQKALMQIFRTEYQALYDKLHMLEHLQHDRGMHTALIRLQESAMWLNKSITNNS